MRKFQSLALIILILITLLMFSNKWPALDMALFLYWGGLDGLFTLMALYRWLHQIGEAEKRKHVIKGALIGLAAALFLMVCITIFIGPMMASSKAGCIALLASSFLLSIGLHRSFGRGRAQWRQRVSFQAANAMSTGKTSLLTRVSFMTTFRAGIAAGLYMPALLAYTKPTAITGGFVLGIGMLLAVLWVVPCLPHKRMVRYLDLSVPLLTIYLCIRFIGIGLLSLQNAGWLKSTPAVMLSIHTTWEVALLQVGLFGALLLTVIRNRRRNKDFFRQINM
ncbi:MAG: hypothetical protein H7X86_07180 [Gorillibacterium sp.]|nr:hypothetical protein [Gorillibacterium sp.]